MNISSSCAWIAICVLFQESGRIIHEVLVPYIPEYQREREIVLQFV